jgi:hypothetical protein
MEANSTRQRASEVDELWRRKGARMDVLGKKVFYHFNFSPVKYL